MAMTFRNIRDEGIIKVQNATDRNSLLPSDGTVVIQLDTDELYAWDAGTSTWVLTGGGGGGGPSFGIIQTDSGTSPTASIATDTLTLTTNDTASYSFDGDALTDTVTLQIVDASITERGLVNTGGQNFLGVKDFQNNFTNDLANTAHSITTDDTISTNVSNGQTVGLRSYLTLNGDFDRNNWFSVANFNSIETYSNGYSELIAASLHQTNNLGEGTVNFGIGIFGASYVDNPNGITNNAAGLVGNIEAIQGTIDNAHGVVVELIKDAGTINTGYGFRVIDIQATDAYGFYNDVTGTQNRFTSSTFYDQINDSLDNIIFINTTLEINNSTIDTGALVHNADKSRLVIIDNEDHSDLLISFQSNFKHEGSGTIDWAIGNLSGITNSSTGIITDSDAFVALIQNNGTITNGYGFRVEGIQATNAYGFYNNASGTKNFLNRLSIFEEDTMTVNGSLIDSKLAVHADDGVSIANVELHKHSDTANAGSQIYGARSRGTGASPSSVNADDVLLQLSSVGYDGTDYATSSQISFEVDGTPGSNDMPGRMVFKTSADGSQTLTERMCVDKESVRFSSQAYFPETTLTDGANISWDVSTNQCTKVILAGNRTLDNPTNLKAGAQYIIRVIQDGTGGRTLTWSANYRWTDGSEPVLSTAANAVDVFYGVSDGTYMYMTTIGFNMS